MARALSAELWKGLREALGLASAPVAPSSAVSEPHAITRATAHAVEKWLQRRISRGTARRPSAPRGGSGATGPAPCAKPKEEHACNSPGPPARARGRLARAVLRGGPSCRSARRATRGKLAAEQPQARQHLQRARRRNADRSCLNYKSSSSRKNTSIHPIVKYSPAFMAGEKYT